MSEQNPPEAAIPSPDPEPKPKLTYLTMWFDDKGDLKFKAEGVDIYAIVGILRAATLKFEKMLAGLAPSVPAKTPDTGA